MGSAAALAPTKNKQVGCEGNFCGYLPVVPGKSTEKQLKSLKTVSESQPLGRADKDKPICPEFPIEMSQDDLSCVSECILEACILR